MSSIIRFATTRCIEQWSFQVVFVDDDFCSSRSRNRVATAFFDSLLSTLFFVADIVAALTVTLEFPVSACLTFCLNNGCASPCSLQAFLSANRSKRSGSSAGSPKWDFPQLDACCVQAAGEEGCGTWSSTFPSSNLQEDPRSVEQSPKLMQVSSREHVVRHSGRVVYAGARGRATILGVSDREKDRVAMCGVYQHVLTRRECGNVRLMNIVEVFFFL